MIDIESDIEADLKAWSRVAKLKASGDPAQFKELSDRLGYIHPDTLAECEAYEEGYSNVLWSDQGGAFPLRPVWRDMAQEASSDDLLPSGQEPSDGLRDSGDSPDHSDSGGGVGPADAADLDAAVTQAEEDDNDRLFSNTDDISEKQALEAQLAQREEELALANERIAELESREPEVRIERVEVERVVPVSSPEAAGVKIVPEELGQLMEEGETLPDARRRLWPILNSELSELKNKEALFNRSIPRRAEVEHLIGILARLGES